MADFGWVTVTAECPADGCEGENEVRVFGSHGDTIRRNPICPTCETAYTVEIVITCSGAVTEYVID